MPDGGEHALDRVRGSQVVPVLGREVVKGQQRVAILHQTRDRPFVFSRRILGERATAASAALRSGAVRLAAAELDGRR
jgi:hypothetical protein